METFLFITLCICVAGSVICAFAALISERSKKTKRNLALLSGIFTLLAACAIAQSVKISSDDQALKRDAPQSCTVRNQPAQPCHSFTLLDMDWTIEPGSSEACLKQINVGERKYKPAPRADLVIVNRYAAGVAINLTILVTSPDAEKWLLENAPEFGSLEDGAGNGVYHLRIYPQVWNVDQVADYIEDMGNSQ